MIEHLERIVPSPPDRPTVAGPDHPVRIATRDIATRADAWTPERAAGTALLFDGLAPEWDARGTAGKMEPLVDALERGEVTGGLCVEVGSGTGAGTRQLGGRFDRVVAIDLSLEMLRRAPEGLAPRVQGDGAHLPLADGAVDVLVLVNAFLFPAEVDRVLAPGGALVWVSTLGDATPIYLSPEEVADALPGAWSGRSADAGWGRWTVLRRRATGLSRKPRSRQNGGRRPRAAGNAGKPAGRHRMTARATAKKRTKKRKSAQSTIDDTLAQLEKQVPKNLKGTVRDFRKNVKGLQKQLSKAQAEREQRWERMERQIRRDVANLLRRLEKAIEPKKAPRKKKTAKKRATKKKAAAPKPPRT
ncbi:MAG: class I SAM-dependent methyltransferase [Myxococcota bacterium]